MLERFRTIRNLAVATALTVTPMVMATEGAAKGGSTPSNEGVGSVVCLTPEQQVELAKTQGNAFTSEGSGHPKLKDVEDNACISLDGGPIHCFTPK